MVRSQVVYNVRRRQSREHVGILRYTRQHVHKQKGIRVSHFQLWAMADKSENRSMVQGEVKRKVKEIIRSRTAEVSKQSFRMCFFYDQTGV